MMSLSVSLGGLHFSFRLARSPKRLSRMALAMGSIMAVVAVLLSHMDREAEVNIIPNISLGKGKSVHFQGILLVLLW